MMSIITSFTLQAAAFSCKVRSENYEQILSFHRYCRANSWLCNYGKRKHKLYRSPIVQSQPKLPADL